MRILGFDFAVKRAPRTLSSVQGSGRGGWYPTVRESYPGAWQQNVEISTPSVLAYHAVFACITLISSDVGKLRYKLVELDKNGIWSEVDSAAFSPVLRAPNAYQNHIQFKEWWLTSKLSRGNTYALKGRDARGVVTQLYLLDPCRCRPLVAPSGEVFYELQKDNLAQVEDDNVTVPASEIIHDRMNCLFHPLVGLSPIYACGLVATQGLAIQDNSALFFQGMSRPGGILTAPGSISNDTASRIKAYWEENFSGANYGRTAVLGDDLKYQPLTMTAQDAQMIEQLKYTAEMVCSVFHVPPFKLGIGAMPTYQNAELLNSIYYSDCLQSQIEQMEACLDDGLSIGLGKPKDGRTLGVELDVASLLRMDTATAISTLTAGVGGGIIAPNEARKRLDLSPLAGGDTTYMQQQNYSLEALSYRDTQGMLPPSEAGIDVQGSAMNGAQVTALQGLLAAVAAGDMPPESAAAAISAAFPLLTPAQVNAMVEPLIAMAAAQPPAPAPTPEPAPPPPVDDPPDDDNEARALDWLRLEFAS